MLDTSASVATSIVSLSNLKSPAVRRVNPHAAEAEEIARKLCFDLGIGLPHIENYNTMAAYLFPEASLDRLVTMILFFNFLYYIDDVYDRHVQGSRDDESELFGTFLTAATVFVNGDKSQVTDEPILRAAYEMHVRFSDQAPRNWLGRFASSLLMHLRSSLMDVDDVGSKEDSVFDRYNLIRDHDAGMESTLDLIEFATGTVLEVRVLQHPVIQDARVQISRYCGLSNDLFSYEKEVVQHDSEFNIVTVLMNEGSTFSYAVNMVIDMLNDMVTHFDELRAQLPLYRDEDTNRLVERYFRGLEHQLSAAYHWQYETPRYRSPQSPFIELQGSL